MPRRELSDFDRREDWEKYADSYWKAQEDYVGRIEALNALVVEEMNILSNWILFGEAPDEWPVFLRGIMVGDFAGWIADLANSTEVRDVDFESLAELFSFLLYEAPGNCWGSPAFLEETDKQWKGVIE